MKQDGVKKPKKADKKKNHEPAYLRNESSSSVVESLTKKSANNTH